MNHTPATLSTQAQVTRAETPRFEINNSLVFFVLSAALRICAKSSCSCRNYFMASAWCLRRAARRSSRRGGSLLLAAPCSSLVTRHSSLLLAAPCSSLVTRHLSLLLTPRRGGRCLGAACAP